MHYKTWIKEDDMKRKAPDIIGGEALPEATIILSNQLAIQLIEVIEEVGEEEELISDLFDNAYDIRSDTEEIKQAIYNMVCNDPQYSQVIKIGNVEETWGNIPIRDRFLFILKHEEKYPNFLDGTIFAKSAKQIYIYDISDYADFISDLVFHAGKAGYLDLVKYLTTTKDQEGQHLFSDYITSKARVTVVEGAVANGHLEIVRYLIALTDAQGKLYSAQVYDDDNYGDDEDVAYDERDNEGKKRTEDNWYMQHITDICIIAVENGRFQVAQYFTTLSSEQGTSLQDYMTQKGGWLKSCCKDNRLNVLSMLGSLPSTPPLLSSLSQAKPPYQIPAKTLKVLALYQEREAALTKQASLKAPYAVYELRDATINGAKLFSPEILELYYCCTYTTALPIELIALPIELIDILAALTLGVQPEDLWAARIFKIPTEQEVAVITVEGIQKMSNHSKLHLALLEKAVEAKNQVSKAV